MKIRCLKWTEWLSSFKLRKCDVIDWEGHYLMIIFYWEYMKIQYFSEKKNYYNIWLLMKFEIKEIDIFNSTGFEHNVSLTYFNFLCVKFYGVWAKHLTYL